MIGSSVLKSCAVKTLRRKQKADRQTEIEIEAEIE